MTVLWEVVVRFGWTKKVNEIWAVHRPAIDAPHLYFMFPMCYTETNGN